MRGVSDGERRGDRDGDIPAAGMTAMSELARAQAVGPRGNRPKPQAFAPVARVVHGVPTVVRGPLLLLALPLWLAAGCVIPPSLTVDNQDAGINSPPAVTAVRYDRKQYREPGPINVVRGQTVSGPLQVEALDSDPSDSLYVRIFVNYEVDVPTPPRSSCVAGAAATGSVTRSCSADLKALCLPADAAKPDTTLMTVRVFDREPLAVGDPPFVTMADPAGLSTAETFHLVCTEPPT